MQLITPSSGTLKCCSFCEGSHIIHPLTTNAATHFTYPQRDGGLSQLPARLSPKWVLNPEPVMERSTVLPTELTWVLITGQHLARLILWICLAHIKVKFMNLHMTQGQFFSHRSESKLVLSHMLSPRSPTMTYSSVRENVAPTLT